MLRMIYTLYLLPVASGLPVIAMRLKPLGVLPWFGMKSELVNAEDGLHSVPTTCGFGGSSHGYEIESGGPPMSSLLVVAVHPSFFHGLG